MAMKYKDDAAFKDLGGDNAEKGKVIQIYGPIGLRRCVCLYFMVFTDFS